MAAKTTTAKNEALPHGADTSVGASTNGPTAVSPPLGAAQVKKDTVLVIIPKPHNVVGDTETVVGVNGVLYQIMYDRPVEVPRNVAEVIEQSRSLQAKIMEITEAAIMKPGKAAIAEL